MYIEQNFVRYKSWVCSRYYAPVWDCGHCRLERNSERDNSNVRSQCLDGNTSLDKTLVGQLEFARGDRKCESRRMEKKSIFDVLRPQRFDLIQRKKKTKAANKKQGSTSAASEKKKIKRQLTDDNKTNRKREKVGFFEPRRVRKGSSCHERLMVPPDALNEADTSYALRRQWQAAEGLRSIAKPKLRRVCKDVHAMGFGNAAEILQSERRDIQPSTRSEPNDEQAAVVRSNVDAPTIVYAGAGTGKTQTIVNRVLWLCEQELVSASSILLVTFSRKASEEISGRIWRAFHKESKKPAVKTFHSLSFAWITMYHKFLGYERPPTVLHTEAGKRRLMRRVLNEQVVKPLQLARCRQLLNLPVDATWDDVLAAMHAVKGSEAFKALEAQIRERVITRPKVARKVRRVEATDGGQLTMAAVWKAAEQQVLVEKKETFSEAVEAAAQAELRYEVYCQLMQRQKPDSPLAPSSNEDDSMFQDDLTEKYLTKQAADDYLQLIETGKRRGHSSHDYLEQEARIWKAYEIALMRDGHVTFDVILEQFLRLLRDCQSAKNRFKERYKIVIVDEFQDNDRMQSEVLHAMIDIVHRVTVFGDDDQTIYGFSGAFVGNFERFGKYCQGNVGRLLRYTMTLNYRCSKNILETGCAFLSGISDRTSKKLSAAKAPGDPVLFIECLNDDDQFDRIVVDILQTRQTEPDVAYSDFAVLFRCFKAGRRRALHRRLQQKLQRAGVPFVVVGSTPLFQQKIALDLQAYLALSVGKESCAFARVLNSPPRRLVPSKVLPILELEAARLGDLPLEDAARSLLALKAASPLSKRQVTALAGFIHLVDDLRRLIFVRALGDFVDLVWQRSGFSAMYADRQKSVDEKAAQGKDDDDEDEEEPCEFEELMDSTMWPAPAQAIREAAQGFETSWKKETAIRQSEEGSSLTSIVARFVTKHANELPDSPASVLPRHLLDLLGAENAAGPSVVSSFLASLSLQLDTCSAEDPDDFPDDHFLTDAVFIGTIHRAKGLEFRKVYVPNVINNLMPCEYRQDRASLAERHLPNCPKRTEQAPNMGCQCSAHYDRAEEARLSHFDEERRLAHVAATRAKDWLTFFKPLRVYDPVSQCYEAAEASCFEADLRRLMTHGVVRFVALPVPALEHE